MTITIHIYSTFDPKTNKLVSIKSWNHHTNPLLILLILSLLGKGLISGHTDLKRKWSQGSLKRFEPELDYNINRSATPIPCDNEIQSRPFSLID